MAKILPYLEVGSDPRDGTRFMLLSLSGARQFREVLDEAIRLISDGITENPEKPEDIVKLETKCGSVHVVFMTDNTLDKVMGVAKKLTGLPADMNPWKTAEEGSDKQVASPGEIPDWLMNLGLSIDGDGQQENDPCD